MLLFATGERKAKQRRPDNQGLLKKIRTEQQHAVQIATLSAG